MEKITLTAVGNNILVIPAPEPEKKEAAKFEEAQAVESEITHAIIHSIGNDVMRGSHQVVLDGDLNGKTVTSPDVGDEVIISKYAGEELEVDGQKYKVIKLHDIFALCGKTLNAN